MTDRDDRTLSTADLAAASRTHDEQRAHEEQQMAQRQDAQRQMGQDAELQMEHQRQMEERQKEQRQRDEHREPSVHEARTGSAHTPTDQGQQLAALFDPQLASDFRLQWSNLQIGFVDDPQRAVQQADELVAQVMQSLAESFARQRQTIETEMGAEGQASTEALRLALRRYRSFFERLLSV